MSDIVARMQNIIQPPWVPAGVWETLEGLLRWFKSNSVTFLFLIILALALALALHLPTPDSHQSRTQTAEQIPVSHSSSGTQITVTARPDYQGPDWYSATSQLDLRSTQHMPPLPPL